MLKRRMSAAPSAERSYDRTTVSPSGAEPLGADADSAALTSCAASTVPPPGAYASVAVSIGAADAASAMVEYVSYAVPSAAPAARTRSVTSPRCAHSGSVEPPSSGRVNDQLSPARERFCTEK